MMTVHHYGPTKGEVREKYDRFASYYDRVEAVPEILGVRALRKDLAKRVRGRTLEIAAGTGKNFRLFPRDIRLVAGDISRGMLAVADEKAREISLDVEYVLFDAEDLPFQDDTFDTVFSTMSSCTFPDPIRAFKEMSRVCRPDGRILLLEHGRSSARPLAWLQDKRADTHQQQFGCRWNRDQVQLVRDSGLQLVDIRQRFFDIFSVIEARPIDATVPTT